MIGLIYELFYENRNQRVVVLNLLQSQNFVEFDANLMLSSLSSPPKCTNKFILVSEDHFKGSQTSEVLSKDPAKNLCSRKLIKYWPYVSLSVKRKYYSPPTSFIKENK